MLIFLASQSFPLVVESFVHKLFVKDYCAFLFEKDTKGVS
jgi:hypothetical protein